MKQMKSRFGSRRQTSNMPIVPFKDSNGATIWGCRRKISDRRTGNAQVTLKDKIVVDDLYSC